MRERIGMNKGWKFSLDMKNVQPYDGYLLTKTGAQNQEAAAVSYTHLDVYKRQELSRNM